MQRYARHVRGENASRRASAMRAGSFATATFRLKLFWPQKWGWRKDSDRSGKGVAGNPGNERVIAREYLFVFTRFFRIKNACRECFRYRERADKPRVIFRRIFNRIYQKRAIFGL